MPHGDVLDGQILNMVQNKKIAEQLELQSLLQEIGYDIPQATLSRRLKKLKIAKVAGVYQVIDIHMPNLPLILNIQVSDFGLIVLHTTPGNANSLGYYFDQKFVNYRRQSPENAGIIGTIAGDDTLLLIIQNKAQIETVLQLLRTEFPYLNLNDFSA